MILSRAPIFVFDRDEEVTGDVALEFIREHQKSLARYDELYNLYINHSQILRIPAKENFKPDVRLSVPFVKYITDTFVGYFNGVPIKKSHEDESFLEIISTFDNNNDMEDEESELLKLACVYGHAFEYMYQNEEVQTKTIYTSPREMFLVFDTSIEQKPLFAIYYGTKDSKYTGTIIEADKLTPFKSNEKGLIMEEPAINPYGKIPVVEYMLNDERLGLYEPVVSLVNAYNKAFSEKANDVDYFSDAYMKILGAPLDETTIERIKDNRIINLHGADADRIVVEFMDKPDSDSQTEHLMDRLERLIFTTSMVANISDENFGQASGTALAYKLQAMSNLALSVQRKFQSSLNRRYELFSSLRTNVPDAQADAWQDLTYTFTRNEPKNILEEAQTAAQLMGITSDETALSVLSIVSDVATEMRKLDGERPNLMDFEIGEEDGQ